MPLIRGLGDIGSIDEMRTVAASLIDQEQRALLATDAGAQVTCRSGCTACCDQAVPVGPAELRAINTAVDELPAEQRRRIRTAIADKAQELRELGFDADALNRTTGAERQAVIERYFAAGVACPLLDDGTCAVRDARPLVCREYLVTSDPRHCETLPSDDVVRVRLGRDVLTGYARAEQSIRDRGMTILALGLDEPIADSAPLPPRTYTEAIRELTTT